MVNGRTRKIVVIKDIPSNIIEEAILILKSDPEAKPAAVAREAAGKARRNDSGYLMKEAEAIINNYMKENKIQEVFKGGVHIKAPRFSRKLLTNTVINLALAGSMLLLVYVIMRII